MGTLTVEQRDFLLPKAYDAALRAGAIILEIYDDGDYGVELDGDRTLVTAADRRSHEMIKGHLGQTRIPLMSEDGREIVIEERRGWDLFWMVDPLDGTREFLKGNGEFTVNIALMADNVPVLGVVYVPYIGRMYFADRLSGSFRKSDVTPDAGAESSMDMIMYGAEALPLTAGANEPVCVAVSRSYDNLQTRDHIDRHFPEAVIVEQGSSYKFCLLAEGTVDYYPRMSATCEWDTAAGELILELAGGQTRSLADGAKLQYNKQELHNPHFDCCSKHMKLPPL